MKQSYFLVSLLIVLHYTKTLAQSPIASPTASPAAAPAPAKAKPARAPPAPPASPTDTVQVLLKAGHFTAFVRLIKATHVDTQLISQLNSSTDGVTIFAPTDTAFSKLRTSALGSLSDIEKMEFVQFHILPRHLTLSDFQTLSNPVKTLAGSGSRFPLSITTTDNSVKLNAGQTKTTVSATVYTDKQVVVYQVEKVLIPKDFFPPAPAPAPSMPQQTPDAVPKDASGAMTSLLHYNSYVLVLLAAGMVNAAISF